MCLWHHSPWINHHQVHTNRESAPLFLLSPVFIFTSCAIWIPSSMKSTTFSKSASLNCREVRAGVPVRQLHKDMILYDHLIKNLILVHLILVKLTKKFRVFDRRADRLMDTQTTYRQAKANRDTSDREKKGSSITELKTDGLTGSAQTTSTPSTLHKNNPLTNTCTCFICVH